MIDKNKREDEKYEAQIYNDIKVFISNSRQVLDILHTLPTDDKKKLTLNITTITKTCSQMSQKRCSQILSYSSQLVNLNEDISITQECLIDLENNKNSYQFLDYIRTKRNLTKRISSMKRRIDSFNKIIISYSSELETYKSALEICSEFGRRLSFYLSFED